MTDVIASVATVVSAVVYMICYFLIHFQIAMTGAYFRKNVPDVFSFHISELISAKISTSPKHLWFRGHNN